jgi:hypothetical protein
MVRGLSGPRRRPHYFHPRARIGVGGFVKLDERGRKKERERSRERERIK